MWGELVWRISEIALWKSESSRMKGSKAQVGRGGRGEGTDMVVRHGWWSERPMLREGVKAQRGRMLCEAKVWS